MLEQATTALLAAPDLARGVLRLMDSLGCAGITEFSLANGRRADIIAIDDKGQVSIVEIKSCWQDYASDGKWPEYREFCDAFYFAVAAGFPRERLPEEVGLIVADRFGGAVLRPSTVLPLPAARRKALLLRLARVAMARLNPVAVGEPL